MCGIFGYVGPDEARRVLHEGLRRLEYRGYDSAGIAVGDGDSLRVTKALGRVDWLATDELGPGNYGIAHTRWATHGAPTVPNAHPHLSCDGRLAIAHNGILENYAELRAELAARGHEFRSETDSEVVAHLIEERYKGDVAAALDEVAPLLKGSWAILATSADEPGVVAATRHESPLVVGISPEATFLASDVVAFLPWTDEVVYLEDGDLAVLTSAGVKFRGRAPPRVRIPWKLEESTLAGFPHYMLKEIHDQPRALQDALLGRTAPGTFPVEGALTLADLARQELLYFVACGSSYHAALAAAPFFERYAGMPVRAVLGSEFPEEGPVTPVRAMVVAVTQSGETADTLNALRAATRVGLPTLAVANVLGSTATRIADAWIPIRAGPEVSVAATKSFCSQLLVLHTLAVQLGVARGRLSASQASDALNRVRDVPALVRRTLEAEDSFAEAGRGLAASKGTAFVLGRGQGHAVALETALKVKEVSYVHAEGLAAGELKHGSLALVERGVPALCMAPEGPTFPAMVAAMREVAARGGAVTALTNAPARTEEAGFAALPVPPCPPDLFPYAAAVAGQLVAYHAAVARGCDVDRPRNLAKSVTVA